MEIKIYLRTAGFPWFVPTGDIGVQKTKNKVLCVSLSCEVAADSTQRCNQHELLGAFLLNSHHAL
jgi:hypothetical protein